MLEIADKRDAKDARLIKDDKPIAPIDVPEGAVFYGEIHFKGKVYTGFFRRTFDHVVPFNDPSLWSIWSKRTSIHNYQPVDARLVILRNAE